MSDEEYQKFIEEYGDVSNYIKDKVEDYRDKEEELLNELKVIFFLYLLNKVNKKTFNKKIDKYITDLGKFQERKINREIKYIEKVVEKQNEEIAKSIKKIGAKITKEDVEKALFKLDNKSIPKARESYIKILKGYYDSSLKTIKKEYVLEEEYLSNKVTQYDKMTKTVPYRSKTNNKIVSYHTFASYNSMVANTNLTRSATNKTIEQVGELSNDLIYVIPHMFSCPLCMQYQGKILSVTGKTKGYESLDDAINNGLLHPNCTHEIVGYWNQDLLSNNYDSAEWEEKYKVKQKINAINREIEKEKTDKVIYQKLNNQEEVDKCNSRLKALYQRRRELQ